MTKSSPQKTSGDRQHAVLAEARAVPVPVGQRSSLIMEHGSMSVRLYSPEEIDTQSPHEQDEVYVVVKGVGWFVNGSCRHRFSAGDILFVPAGVQHRFEDFKGNLTVWVIFYGPKGGELTKPDP